MEINNNGFRLNNDLKLNLNIPKNQTFNWNVKEYKILFIDLVNGKIEFVRIEK